MDASIAIVFASAIYWAHHEQKWLTEKMDSFTTGKAMFCFSFLIFIWLNVVLLRTLQTTLGIAYTIDSLWNTMIVQASLSIFWTVTALIVTTVASRIQSRDLWFCGFGLLTIVIIKLFLIDLGETHALSRIITFVGVGVLMLINGYISPLPPKK
jgi:uncharacterized membrane protein